MERERHVLNDICPGLFRMKLNLMHTSDQAQVENRKIALDTASKREHDIVLGVVDLMRTLLDNPLQKHRYIGQNIRKLERYINNNPKHLNTLADLAELYRTSNLTEKAEAIDDRIKEILESSDTNDIKEKAICTVEQGYAVLFEEFTENEIEAKQKLVDSFELIKAEQKISVGERKDLLSRASKYTVNARRLLCLAINCRRDDSITAEKKQSMEMFQKGIQCLRETSYSIENIYIWTYYYAMACNRMHDVTNVSGVKAVELFWSVIVNLPKDNIRYFIYRARAYAYIGQKIISWGDAFYDDLANSSSSSDVQFKDLLEKPLSAFELAIAELPDDEVIFNRKGNSLWSMVKYGPAVSEHKKREYLEEAEKALSYSITQNPRMHLLAFSTRLKVYLELSSLPTFTAERKRDFLHKALHDGQISMNSNLSAQDACTVAEICQRLAKYPKINLYGPEAVSNTKYLNEALDYLNRCISAKGQTYYTAFRIGTIYFDMGEYRIAIEWLKRAFLCSDYTRSFENIKKLCMSILELGTHQHVNVEFIHVLTYIASKKNNLTFINDLVPTRLWEKYLERLWEFLKFLETFDLTVHQVRIAEYLKAILTKKDFQTARRLRICQYTPSTRYDLEYDLNTASMLHVDIGSVCVPHHYRYDYFIIMSAVNSGWIQCFLQHQLGIQMSDHDTSFTGWPCAINYDSCSSLLETTIEGIKECRKSILVISKDFLKREWCVLKKIITEAMQMRPDFLRIILLENCDIPQEIVSERLSFFDFTDDKNIPIEVQHLKLALLEN